MNSDIENGLAPDTTTGELEQEHQDLKSLDEFNAERCQWHRKQNYPMPNGVACPCCGGELLDIDAEAHGGHAMYPVKNVRCSECFWYGERIV